MGIVERKALYQKIESIRKRPMIAYVTSPRPDAHGLMGVDAIAEILDQLDALASDGTAKDAKAIDLLVVSNGGDPTVAWRIMSLLRERFQKVAVLLPQAAFSAATLLALGADEIVMHPHANLGPVDPQIQIQRKIPGTEQIQPFLFGSEELAGFLDFVRGELALTDQEHLRILFEGFCKEVGTVAVGYAARGSRLSLTMGEKLLKMHMSDSSEAQKARGIAEALNKGFAHHGYPLSRNEAKKDIGLKVANSNVEIETLIWMVWKDMETELKVRKPFNPIGEVAENPAAQALFAPPVTVNLPSGLPPNVLQQAYQQVLQQIGVQQIPPTDFEIIAALMESPRYASRSTVKGKIFANRTLDLQLQLNAVKTHSGWEQVPV